MGRPRLRHPITRDSILLTAGILGVAHETLIAGPTEHPYLLAVFAAWTGLPFIIRFDQQRQQRNEDLTNDSDRRRRDPSDWDRRPRGGEPYRSDKKPEGDSGKWGG